MLTKALATPEIQSLPALVTRAADALSLTAKQQRFVDEYLVDLNATQAAIRSGHSAKTAAIIGICSLRRQSAPNDAAGLSSAKGNLTAATPFSVHDGKS